MSVRMWLLIILIGAVWGCSFLFNAVLIRDLSPLWVSALRISVGALGCWAFFIATRRRLPDNAMLYPQLLLLGMMNYAIPFALFPLAEQSLPSGLVGVINAMTPMTTVIVSQVWPGGERATWNKVVGVVIGFCGASILALPSLEGGSTELWAIGACLLATFCYALVLNYARRFRNVDSVTVAASSLTGAAIVSVPFALLANGTPSIVHAEAWAALGGIGLVSTSLAFLLMYWLLPRVGATNFSINTFITPISAILLGGLVLGERFEATHLIGIGVIFVGLIFIDGRLVRRFRPVRA